jgi:hypothetical protein
MIIGGLDTRVAMAQLNHLFDIEAIFKRRGRKVIAYEKVEDVLFDLTVYDASEKYYPLFHSTSFRQIVRVVANRQIPVTADDVLLECRDLDGNKVSKVLGKAVEFGLLVKQDDRYLPSKPVGFGSTFEWYVASVCMEELSSIAYWGVKVEQMPGDYDVVVIRENQIGYIECKSGKFSNITKDDIANFLLRERVLAPQFSVYLVDGISRENLSGLVRFALEQKLNYEFEIPGVMSTNVSLEAEEYKNFIRLIPINSFFVATRDSLASTLREVYEFLTLVYDRSLPTENMAMKDKFRQTRNELT